MLLYMKELRRSISLKPVFDEMARGGLTTQGMNGKIWAKILPMSINSI